MLVDCLDIAEGQPCTLKQDKQTVIQLSNGYLMIGNELYTVAEFKSLFYCDNKDYP